MLALRAEELLVDRCVGDRLVDIDWHLEPILDVLARRETSEEAAVLRSGVPRVARVDDHSSDVANRLVDLVRSAVRETVIQPRVDGLLVREEPVELPRGQGLLALREARFAIGVPIGLVQYFRVEVLCRGELVPRLTSLRLDLFVDVLVESLPARERKLSWLRVLGSVELDRAIFVFACGPVGQLVALLVDVEGVLQVSHAVFHSWNQLIVR